MRPKTHKTTFLAFSFVLVLATCFTACSVTESDDITIEELNMNASTANQRNSNNIKKWLQNNGGSTWRLQTNRNNGDCNDYTYNQLDDLLDAADNEFAYLIGIGYSRLKLRVEESQDGSCYGSRARTELRQTNSSNTSASWSTSSTQELDISLRMIKIDDNFERVCIAQYFGNYTNDNDDIVKVVAIKDGNNFDIRLNHSGLSTGSQDLLIANNHRFKQKFRIRMYTRRHNGRDQIRVRYDGPATNLGSNNNRWLNLDNSARTSSAYWKTGLYVYTSRTSGGSAEAEWYDIDY